MAIAQETARQIEKGRPIGVQLPIGNVELGWVHSGNFRIFINQLHVHRRPIVVKLVQIGDHESHIPALSFIRLFLEFRAEGYVQFHATCITQGTGCNRQTDQRAETPAGTKLSSD